MANPSAYNGNEPYIFISYAHKDSDKVLPIIRELQSRGYRVWYDAGIEAVTLGLSERWAAFAKEQDSGYNYKDHRYQIHDGLDCSVYVCLAVYNVMETENGGEGYVSSSTVMAQPVSCTPRVSSNASATIFFMVFKGIAPPFQLDIVA